MFLFLLARVLKVECYIEFCVLQIFSEYARLPSKKGITIFDCSFAYILPAFDVTN